MSYEITKLLKDKFWIYINYLKHFMYHMSQKEIWQIGLNKQR